MLGANCVTPIRICEICVSARGIENKCNSECGKEEQANSKTEDKEDDKKESEA
ncbi:MULTISPECIES: hypothetical protein [Methanosarcina]|uniref:hypothetical protein n=1 Tax=Methanosarcina TaxID=2207 RepID=UPI000B2E2A72|nr:MULTISPECIES: hypothetical protein [Methanosarcina]